MVTGLGFGDMNLSWFLSFRVFVCMFVCESGGGGGACMDRCVGENVLVRHCERVTAFFGFWLPRFVCVCGFVNVCTRRCVCVCVCVCVAAVVLDAVVGFGVVWHRL